jgi:hypothetical protein
MKRFLFAASALGAALLLALSAPLGTAEEDAAKKDEATYVGSDACKKCHFKQHRYWKKTKLKTSMDRLKATPETEKELFDAKKKAGLDPAKDYTTDAKCLACHTTGYGKKGGYPKDAAKDDAAKALAASMGEVGCEACHGAGSKYSKHKTDTLAKDKEAKFTFDGLAKYGLTQPDKDNCATCHNDKNPTDAGDFKYDDKKGEVHSKKKKKK